MFKALMGGNRSSSDVASTSSSKSSRRRKDSKSTVSRKSSRGDDRERGLGDLSAYSPSGSRRYRGERESIVSPADPENLLESDRRVIERVSKGRSDEGRRERYRDGDDWDSRSARRRDRDRSSRDYMQRSRTQDDLDDFDRERESSRKERRRTQSGDPYPPPLNTDIPASGASAHFAADISAPEFSQFPMQYDAMIPGSTMPEQAGSPAVYDPHVHQQFPGQFPASVAEPYRPPNPAGEAADYYGDQGESVAEQPGVRPQPPAVIPNSQAHLMPASPSANPPPEPSSMGQVGAAAAYYTDDPESQTYEQPAMPPNSSHPQQSGSMLGPATAAAAGAAAHGVGSGLHGHVDSPPHSAGPIEPSNMTTYTQPVPASPPKPSHSHMGAAVGAAAATAAAGYMIGHHHHSSSSPEHLPQYGIQNYEYPSHGIGPMYGPGPNPALVAPGATGVAGYGPAVAHGMHPYAGPGSHGPAFHSGGLAFQQPQRGPLGKFVDFWRDPEGVGMFEDYTETIGLCRYCFEPGTTSRDAPRKHHYNRRRRSWDRYSSGSRVDKLSRFPSSEEEGRRRRKSRSKSWLPGLLAGYAAKSLFSNKSFDDSYSVKSGRVLSPRHSMDDSESISTLDRKSQTSRGVYRHSNRSRSRDRYDNSSYSDLKSSRYDHHHHTRSRSRSRSSSQSRRHSALRDAALGAAVGAAGMKMYKSRHRSRSPKRAKTRKGSSSSSSDSSYSDIAKPAKKSVAGGLASFFMTPSANRKKRPSKRNQGFFSFNNSSSSSLDADLAFGSGYRKKGSRKSKRKADRERDVDARLMGLGAAATALAASSHRHNRRTGEILAAKDSRSGRSDYTPSATNDDGWEDLDSADQSSSSVSSALAFGGDDSQTSDSGTSKWGWRWGGKKDKKKGRSDSSGRHHHTGAAAAAGALGGAALASAYHHSHSKPPSQDNNVSSTGSLQHVYPMPTSDPSRFDAVRVPSGAQPTLVRPGPIPLQQPQPVTPVSHAVYTTQGEPTYYPALSGPPGVGNVYPGDTPQYQDKYMGQRDLGYRKPHRRSDSSPVFGTEPREDVSTTGPKRRSTMKDQASVQFDLTEEQMRKERRANRRDRERNDSHHGQGPQLIDREHELALQDAEPQARRRVRENEARQRDEYHDRSSQIFRPPSGPEDRERRRKDANGTDSASWVGAAAAGTIGAAAAASVLSDKKSRDDSSEVSQGRYSERREKRRAERRRADSQTGSVVSDGRQNIEDIPPVSQPDTERRESELYRASSRTPPHDNYAQFFAPEGLRYSPDRHTREQSTPKIVEIEPANERFSREMSQFSEASYGKHDALPWPVPRLNLIEPTPPQSVSGSVRGAASPTSVPADRPYEKAEKPEKQKSASRVSWGEHQTHEYDAPSTSPERDSSDNDGVRELERSKGDAPYVERQEPSAGYGADVEFAATVAAATAAAGFDPSLVTDDPAYHTRVSQYGPTLPRGESHGFVEGEVETSDSEDKGKQPMAERSREAEPEIEHFIEGKPIYSEPESFAKDREVLPAAEEKGSSSEPELIERPTREHSDAEQHFSMPGGFEPDDSPRQSRDREIFGAPTDTRSVFSAPVAGEFESLSRSRKSGRSDEDFEDIGDNAPEHAEAEGTEEKRKRRKRRSKRHSGNLDDTASVTSSPAKIEEVREKRESKDEKEKARSSSGFFGSFFGSRVSEPAEPRRSPSVEGHTREVKSEIGTGEREESRRRKKRSSRHRSSDSMDVLDDPGKFEERGSDKEEQGDVNIENYKSHRQRREERRRHRYEDIVGSSKGPDYEKDRQDDDNADRQSSLKRGPETLDDREGGGASGLATAMAAGAAGLGLGMIGEHLRNRSTSPAAEETAESQRATSPGMLQDEQPRGQRSRRASMMNDSPTAVPLHFRRPPVSPGANRPASASSPAAPQPDSPTQSRHRRPASTEFKNSREIRPLWLVERHGGKGEDQFDEPLPSLPSSKPSSKSPSMEDLKTSAEQDVRSWEPVDVNDYVHEGRRSPGLRISTERHDSYAEHDVLGSQQTTPTAQTFSAADQPAKKEKPKYEFHSPSELLQDPSVYAELPPSPTLGALPSAEGSAVGVSDGSGQDDGLGRNLENLPPLPDSRPATPQEQEQEQFSTPVAEAAPAEANEESTKSADIAKGVGFAGIVGAAVSAAVRGTEKESTRELSDEQGHTEFKEETLESDTMPRGIEPSTTEQTVAQDLEDASQSRELPEAPRPSSPSQQAAPAGFAEVVEAAVAATDSKDDKGVEPADTTHQDHVEEPKAEPAAVAEEKKDLEEPPSADREMPEDIQVPAESAGKASEGTPQTPVEEPTSTSSFKKKKKNKKKKGQSMDLTEPESTPASPAVENDAKREEPAVEQEPALDTTGAEKVPSGVEARKELEAEPAQPKEPQLEVAPAAENDAKSEEPVVEQGPVLDATGAENVPRGVEASKESEPEPAQPEEPQPEVAPAADAEEAPSPELSSKKAKRDKKKKRKSKGPEPEEQPAESATGEAEQPATEAVTEQESTQPPAEDPQTAEVIPGEDASRHPEESIATPREGPTEPSQPPEQEQEQVAPPEEAKELDVEQSGTEHKPDQTESQEHAREPDDAPVEWQDALESPADTEARQLPEEDKQEATPEITETEPTKATAEPEVVTPEPEQSQPEQQQETAQETPAPVEDSAATDVAPEPPAQDQEAPAADQEPETGLSRKASKKNKKKNKRKSTAETPVESEAAEAKEPATGGEALEGQSELTELPEAAPESERTETQGGRTEESTQEPPTGGEALEGQAEPTEPPEPPEAAPESEQTETQRGQAEESAQEPQKEDGPAPESAIDAQAEPTAADVPSSVEQPQEVSGVEGAEEQPKKKSKKGKKNRKSSSVSEAPPEPEPEHEPESKPEQSEFVDAPESQPPQTSDDIPAVDENQPTPETKYEDAPPIDGAEPATLGTGEEPTPFEKQPETDIEGTGASEQPSTAEDLPAEAEAQDAPVENDTTVDTQESQEPAEADIPLTPAQKKKAKEDKKKKRQSSLAEETLAPEPASESTEMETAPEGDTTVTGEPTESAAVPDSEQPAPEGDSATAPTEHTEGAPKEDEPTDDSAAGLDKDITATAEDTAQSESVDHVAAATESAPTGEEQEAKEAPVQEEPKDITTEVVEEPVASAAADADSTQQEPKDGTSLTDEATSTDEKQEVTSELEPQTGETKAVTDTEENVPGDGTAVEDSQEPTQEETTSGPAEEQAQDQTEDVEPATSKKSKKDKKKKKKRLSLTPEDEPTEQAAPSGEPEVADTSSEAAADNETKTEEVAPEEAAPETTPAEPSAPEPVEEPQSAISKKKAKKDKKKRKSVSFDIEEPAEQPTDSTEAVPADVTPQADEAKPEDTSEPPAASSEGVESAELEKDREQPVDSHKEEPSATSDDQGESSQPAESASTEDQSTGPSPESTTEEAPEPEATTATSDLDNQPPFGEEEKTDAGTPVPEPEKTDATDTVPEAEIPKETEEATGTEPVATEEPSAKEPESPKPDDAEQDAGTAKSKKDKKKKKKRKTLELTDEAPAAAPEPVNDAQPESDRAADPDTTDVKETEEAAQEPEKQEIVEQEPEKQDENQGPEEQELEKQQLEKQEDEKRDEAEKQEPEKEENEKQEEKPFMSAKEKRKAKKDKKRQSKHLDRDDNDQNTAASTPVESAPTEDASQDVTATKPTEAETSVPSPATVVPPAEDDGKANQSHDTQPSGDQEKDRIWTDEMVSSQVEQQQATSSAFPPHPEPDRAKADQSLIPSGNEPESSGPDAENKEGPATTPTEPEAPADEGVTHDDKTTADVSEPKIETETGLESREGVEEVESKHEQAEGIPESENIPSVPTEESIEQSTTPAADPAAPSEADNSKPEVPAAEAEDLVATSSSKKKKKKKQKQKEKQLEENQLAKPTPSADNTEQQQGDVPATEEPALSSKENAPELGQVNDEPVAEAVEPEPAKEPVDAPEGPPLESGQKGDEPVAEPGEVEVPKKLETPSEEPALEPDQKNEESVAEPVEIEAPKEPQAASEEPVLESSQKEDEPVGEQVEIEAPKELATASEEAPLESGQKEEEPVIEPMETEALKELPTASEEHVQEPDQKANEPPAEPAPDLEPPKEHTELTKDVTATVEESIETPGLSRKMSKKEKKKKRRSLAQDTTSQEQAEEQPALEGETTVSAGPDNATTFGSSGDQEDKLPANSDAKQDAFPEEQASSMKDTTEAQVEPVEPVDSMNDAEKNLEIGDSLTADDGNTHEQPATTGDMTDAGQSPLEKPEEPSRLEPGADEATREIQDQPEDSSIPTSKKKAKKNKKKALAQEASIEESPHAEEPSVTSEPTDNTGDAAEPTTEMQPTETLPDVSTEEKQEGAEEYWAVPSKKKGKKAKKEKQKAKSQQEEVPEEIPEEVPTPVDMQDYAPAETASASANGAIAPPPENVVMVSNEQPRETEQAQQEKPSVSLDPVEVPPEAEAMDVDLPTGPTDAGAERELPENDIQDDSVSKEQQEAKERQESQEPEKKDDIEMAEALVEDRPKELEDEAPLSRKLSKKEKRKAKQKALEGAIELSQQPEPEPEVSKETEVPTQTTEDPTALAVEQANEDIPLSRSASKKKKKAKKGGQSMEPEQEEQQEQQEQLEQPEPAEANEPAITPTEHAPTAELQPLEKQQSRQDEESWPSIDWNKDKAENPPEQVPEPMPEPQQVDVEPGPETIGEFDESAIPWAVPKEPEQLPVEDTWSMPSKKKDKKRKKSQPREAEPVPVPASEPEQETERTIPDEAAKEDQVRPSTPSKIADIFPELERGSFRRPATKAASQSGKDNAEDETIDQGAQVSEAPIATIDKSGEDAGTWPSPDNRGFGEVQSLSTVPDPFTEQTTSREIDAPAVRGLSDEPAGAARSVETQLPDKDQENIQTSSSRAVSDPTTPSNPTCSLRRSPSIHGKPNYTQRPWSLDETTIETAREASAPPSLFGGPFGGPIGADIPVSPPRTPLGTIAEQEPESHVERAGGTTAPDSGTPQLEVKPEHMLPYPHTPVRKFTDNALDRQRWPTPDKELPRGVEDETDGMQKRSRTNSPATPRGDWELPPGPILKPRSSEKRMLRRTMRSGSGDLRAASRAQETSEEDPKLQPQPQPQSQPHPHLSAPADPSVERIASSSSYDPVTDKGKRPVRGMTDVIEAWGETPTSPRSPSRPPSVRHRRSMQHLQDLETRLDQLISENRLLVAAREEAEGKLKNASVARRKSDHALNSQGADLRDKEAEVEQLRSSVEWFQKEVTRLTEENEGLTTTNTTVAAAHAQELLAARQSSTRELDDLRSQYRQLSTGVEDRVRQEVDTTLAAKNAEIRRLHEELEATRGKVKELQRQIATSMQDDVLVFRDEDYFDGACQRLCGHVQQWVLRFSKHSDHHRCRKLADLHDEKIADRFDNAILDGSDADAYLADRVRRRDVLMSVVMTMIWEYIFTRYLFGMDRDQRQKLKSLEKHLVEVGTRSAVHRWRATTLTLLSKRSAFSKQRESDTEAVALEIFGTLSRLLPPPTHVEGPLLESLRKVLRVAVNLSIEMRTQLAEYIMLPPLQPEYDTNGDLARCVYFNASLMNERSGETTSNQELETHQSVVRIVLFPLVVKKGNDTGEGEDEVVVCPAQVLIARAIKSKSVMSLNANRSAHSIAPPSTMDMSNVI